MMINHEDLKLLSQQFESALLKVDRLSAKEIITRPNQNLTPLQIVEYLVVPGLTRIGKGWEEGTYSLSQIYMSGRICEELVDLILPPNHETRIHQPKMAIVTLEDFHLLGKRIVYSTLRASGFEISDYGQMTMEKLEERIISDQIQILLISVLMLPSALKIKNLRKRLEAENIAVKIVVGGAPFQFDRQLWQEVKADAFGESASAAVEIIHRMIKEMS
jgi:methanogenic corrinoid protein MtbC1